MRGAAIVFFLVVLAACNDSQSQSPPRAERAPRGELRDPCSLLSSADAADIAGVGVAERIAPPAEPGALVRTCSYVLETPSSPRPEGAQVPQLSLDVRRPKDADAQIDGFARLSAPDVHVEVIEHAGLRVVRVAEANSEMAIAAREGVVYRLNAGAFAPKRPLAQALADVIGRAH